MREKCGVFGIFGAKGAAYLTYAGLYALQHRGQESAGIAVSDGRGLRLHTGMGRVMEVFGEGVLRKLGGCHAIGHTRYSTWGRSEIENAQPLLARLCHQEMALAHNGQITNASYLREELEREGAIFQGSSDTEVLFHLIAKSSKAGLLERLFEACSYLEGAFSFLLLCVDRLIGVRDPYGFRPLCLGQRGESYVLASESCALDLIEARYLREVAPGEVVVIDGGGMRSYSPFSRRRHYFCVFELIYFARPDSIFRGESVLRIRQALGEQLALEAPCEGADLVIGVPDSSTPAAMGYARALGLRFDLGLIRNHYIGRTFIEPTEEIRAWRAKIKYNPVRSVVEGRSLVLVDDSLVRGTTCRRIIRLLQDYGARRVHLRVASPVMYHSCYYGIDTPEPSELVGHRRGTLEGIRRELGADSVAYLTLEGLRRVMERFGFSSFCHACFSGQYPTRIFRSRGEEEKF